MLIFLKYWKFAAVAILLAYAYHLGAEAVKTRWQAEKLQQAIDAQKIEDKGHAVSLNLETGLNDYKPISRELDKEVNNATSFDSSRRFDNSSVKRTEQRIQTGEKAREKWAK